jgi:enoyl-CoA hydratase
VKPEKYIKAVDEDKVRIITIDRPPVNALSRTLLTELRTAFQEFKKDRSVKAAILRTEGSAYFTAGADLKDFSKIKNLFQAWNITRTGQKLFNFIESINKPIICAINGICVGGGVEMALSCHYRIASEQAGISVPEIRLGIIPGWGGSQRLPRIIGPSKATELILTGDKISAVEGRRIGLIDKVVPEDELLEEAKRLGGRIAKNSLVTIDLAMKAIRKSLKSKLASGLHAEAKYFLRSLASRDCKEGVRAFMEKRGPQFKDR